MLTDERHDFIRRELAAKGRVLAGDLAERFSVSEDTARRDLRELAKAGDCRRVYGGAVAVAPNAGSIKVRRDVMNVEKAKLAKASVQLMQSGQSIFIDSGSTNIAIARAIPADIALTVATNSLGVACALKDHAKIRLVVLGGDFNTTLGACVGEQTLHAISRLHADLLFLGSCGIDVGVGVTAFDSAEAEIKRAMIKSSSAVVVAATADKLVTAAPFRVVGPEMIQHLVVDSLVQTDVITDFEKTGISVHLA